MTDTVGFILKLPHHLVDAFRSTLEEARYADMLVHVVDASNPDRDLQMKVVYETLSELHISGKPILTIWNRFDILPAGQVLRIPVRIKMSGFPQRQEKGNSRFLMRFRSFWKEAVYILWR